MPHSPCSKCGLSFDTLARITPAPPEITADAQGGSGLPSFIIFDFTEKKNELFYNEFR